ncbi:MAG: IS701 family transposase [Gemmatimonadaceae bacterium]
MDSRALAAAERRLTSFLDDFLSLLGRSERRHWAELYVRGLLLDGERKSIEPMAGRLPGADVQALRQFVNQSPWDWAPVQEALTIQMMDRLLPEAMLILDETSFPKQGTHSVGVARQYCGALGKTANCQVAVSLHLGTDTGCVPLVWKLYLPETWTNDPARRAEAGIPTPVGYRTKTELALDALDAALARGVGRRVVLADSAYGNSFAFRAALTARELPYCVQVEPTTKAWLTPPAPNTPPAYQGHGRPRRRPPRNELPMPHDFAALAHALPATAWHGVTWRPGSKGPLRSRFARVPVWLAHRWTTTRTVPTTAVDLLIEWPRDEAAPTKYWLADLRGESAGLRRLVRLAKGRWRIEMDYRELKEEVGLDHFEGRSWTGWHHHVTLATLAYAFLVLETVRGKKNGGDDVTAEPRVVAAHAASAR